MSNQIGEDINQVEYNPETGAYEPKKAAKPYVWGKYLGPHENPDFRCDWHFVCEEHDEVLTTYSWMNAMESMWGHIAMHHDRPTPKLDALMSQPAPWDMSVYAHLVIDDERGFLLAACGKVWMPHANVMVTGKCPDCLELAKHPKPNFGWRA